ncbi:HD domain-containing protein [Alkalihalobacillus sp. LMS39]|uniref:HD domain-containing protein n=1 Tax=Alkalihalobacillus sp. LMS39 TaxID=2924032 RepID=UPI001FB29630|nr:HD domain-containing protein [Alkalihalobacillus sp. LMS39]UOE95800.1 HD domain-containing protein [Alkalihalobacillus sp. LMS39]
MILYDTIYGQCEVTGVMEELLNSSPVQRLKGIHQGGASYLVNPKWNVTRYDHSVGAMILVKHLGGSVEEQVAALLHDVSHTAFSHVVDFVFDNEKEDYHEKIYESVLTSSEIPEILVKYGFDEKAILYDHSKWTLLEQPAPELCVDRIDYTLRDMYEYGHITEAEVKRFLQDIVIIDGKIHLQSIEVAEWFVDIYYKEVIGFFMDPLNIYGYDVLANVIQYALHHQYLTLDDLLGEDEEVMLKLQNIQDSELQQKLSQLHPQIVVEENEQDYDIYRKNKVRLIDPSMFYNGKIQKASTLSEKVKQLGDEAYHKATRGAFVKVLSSSRV